MEIKIKEGIQDRAYVVDKERNYWRTMSQISGKWVKVDTQHLFNNQYNLLDYDVRVMDSDVIAVRDDARIGAGKCNYCGKMVYSEEEAEAHFKEEEEKINHCKGCYWWRFTHFYKDINNNYEHKHEEEISNDDGLILQVNETIRRTGVYGCTYEKNNNESCTHKEHRKFGIDWFTEKNTYFIKYPNGYDYYYNNLNLADKFRELKYSYDPETMEAESYNKIGSYNIIVKLDDEKHFNGVMLRNTKKEFLFNKELCEQIKKSYYHGILCDTLLYKMPKTYISDVYYMLKGLTESKIYYM